MSRRIVVSVLASVAVSIGGFFASCGSHDSRDATTALVLLPGGCSLVSPKDELGAMADGVPVAKVSPGRNRFVVECGGPTIEVDKDVAQSQHTVSITAEDVR